MRRLLLALLLAGYAAVFVTVPSVRGGARPFEPLGPRGREVERAIEERRFADALPVVKALAIEYPADATVAYWLAETFNGLDQFADEARAWERVFELTRLADAACPALAAAYARAGDAARALDAHQRCAAAASDDPERWIDLAAALAGAGRAADAAAAIDRARAIDPAHPALSSLAQHDATPKSGAANSHSTAAGSPPAAAEPRQ
ncbi:MAG TPA: hypothetical protein VM032_15675 [Vicinamibacterales bacterium]|nr:hypothetical protein [Vicinamibacterales bacterium]